MIEETLPFIFMDFIIFHTQTLCLGYNVFLQIFTLNFFFFGFNVQICKYIFKLNIQLKRRHLAVSHTIRLSNLHENYRS